ncbi:MAG: gamma-butyrobetaine hydroxylase family protein [Gallionella sp.]
MSAASLRGALQEQRRTMSKQPTEIKLHQQSRTLEITFGDGESYQLSHEYLRVYSPSADVSGHGPGQEVLQTGKKDVVISSLVPVGSYAVQINFDDGHDTGLYTWEYLYKLGENHAALWQDYLDRLAAADASREPRAGAKK